MLVLLYAIFVFAAFRSLYRVLNSTCCLSCSIYPTHPASLSTYRAVFSLSLPLSTADCPPMSHCSRVSLGSLAGSTWTCDHCSYVNKARENECGSCPTPKPNPYAFASTTSSTTRMTRASHSASLTSPPPARRQLRSSAAANTVASQHLTDYRATKRKTRSILVPATAVALEVAAEKEDGAEQIIDDESSDSDDDSLQQRLVERPKRRCVEQTQQRVNEYFKATKFNTTSTTTTATTTPQTKPAHQQAPADNRLPHHSQLTPPPSTGKPKIVELIPPAVVVGVPAAFVPPLLAPTPFVPASRDATIALLNRVHATLALSAFPTTTATTTPTPLPSRHLHLTHLCHFLSRHVGGRTPAALYIAGRPGVGKTLTVDWALRTVFGAAAAVLGSGGDGGGGGGGGGGRVWRYGGGRMKSKARGGVGLPVTTVVTVNAIAMMKGHGSFWCKLLALLTTNSSSSSNNSSRQHDDLLHLPADEAHRRLQHHINTTRNRNEMIVLVVDEIDALLSSSSVASQTAASVGQSAGGGSVSLLHALFRTVYGASSCVVLVSISNNITLLDSHCTTLAATHSLPERVVFSTYTEADLLHILHERLLRCLPAASGEMEGGVPVALPFFAPAALEFICKATSKDTGDIRRCLRDCRTAVQQLLTTCTSASSAASAAFDPASCQLTVSSLARVKAEREAATQHGRLAELSVQQLHVLWVVALLGGVAVGNSKAGEWYRRCVSRVRGCHLTELSGGEVCAVLDMLESEGMVRRDKLGKVVRYVSVVSVERMRRQLRGDIWDALWLKADLIHLKA